MNKNYLYIGGAAAAGFLIYKWWKSKQPVVPFVPSTGAFYVGPGNVNSVNVGSLTGTGASAQ
jgi:hypothetical protein